MYIFKSGFLKHKKSGLGYTDVDVSRVKLADIFSNYVDGYLTLTHSLLRGVFYITLENLRASPHISNTNWTLEQWFRNIPNKELDTIRTKPRYITGEVLYSDAFKAGFKVSRVGRRLPKTANISTYDKVDLMLEKNIPNKQILFSRLMISVSGFMHRVDYHDGNPVAIGGGTTFNESGINTVGVWSFNSIGDMLQVAITQNMIGATKTTQPYYKETLIKLDQDISGKSLIVVLGGYMFIGETIANIINPETGLVSLKLSKLDIPKLIFNSIGYINLDRLGIFSDERQVDYHKHRMSDLLSDIVIRKWLTLEQSFICILDSESVQHEYKEVSVTGLPDSYETPVNPSYPMVNSVGRVYDYWKYYNANGWSIKLVNDILRRPMYTHSLVHDNEMLDLKHPTYKWRHDDPRFLIITATKFDGFDPEPLPDNVDTGINNTNPIRPVLPASYDIRYVVTGSLHLYGIRHRQGTNLVIESSGPGSVIKTGTRATSSLFDYDGELSTVNQIVFKTSIDITRAYIKSGTTIHELPIHRDIIDNRWLVTLNKVKNTWPNGQLIFE